MELTKATGRYLVIDQLLPDSDFEELWKYMQVEHYHQVHAFQWFGAWRLDDGQVMRAPDYSYGSVQGSVAKHPTGRPLDILFEAILSLKKELKAVIGEESKDWDGFSLLPMLYPRNSSLYWHRDNKSWAGSYTFYCHPEWNIHWGGEMLVGDGSMDSIPEEYGIFFRKPQKIRGAQDEVSLGSHLDNSEANSLLLEEGIGAGDYIAPLPNRLVVLRGGVAHSVSKVLPAAGDHLRASMSGFFKRAAASA